MGALTVDAATLVKEDVGISKLVVSPVTFTGTYATSGDALVPSEIPGLRAGTVAHISFDDTILNSYEWDSVNNLVLAYVKASGLEVANGVDLTGEKPVATVWGR